MSLSSSPLQPVSENQTEVLYATEAFRVLLWHVNSSQNQPFVARLEGNAKVRESQCILVSGQIAVTNEKIGTMQPKRGQRFILEGNVSNTARMVGETQVILLELQWGSGLPVKPLHEITETRPWGSFTVLKDEPTYKLKELSVKPGNRLSLQRHFKREEHWLVTQGHPEVFLDETIHRLQPGGYIHIPLQGWHRITNPEQATENVEIIELQLGDYFGEDDIERGQDDYGRQ